MAETQTVLVTGGTGYTGRRLLHRLRGCGAHVRVLARSTSDLAGMPEHVEIIQGDLEEPDSLVSALGGVRYVYHLAHVRFTANLLRSLTTDVEHVVIVSSLRALSRVPSATVDQVLQGESAAITPGPATSASWTILRPSMIFGDGDDRNISRLVDRVRRRALIPAVGRARLHQPVYVEDVLDAVLACPTNSRARGQTYAIAGARPLTWDELVSTIGHLVGERPRTVPVPAAAAASVLGLIEALGLTLPVRAEQVRRMLEDKAFDIEPARRDLGFSPLSFGDALQRILATEEGHP
ncbi:MAG TPA: NAD(P)H-binding protein [Candidatus Latescibacteria bacterium]|nr:NAD(P)H-binding protein [Candidatus Latescibacterota bacterium]HJP34158.1 NAD(P)H-binding protein [Candidatus Latescibacterota bacterium]